MGLTEECALVDDVREERDDFVETAGNVFSLINSVQFKVDISGPLGTILEGIREAVRQAAVQLRGEVNALQRDIDAVIDAGMGNPCKLRELAEWWTTNVTNPVRELPGFLAESAFPALSTWEGDAGQSYRNLVEYQRTALENLATATERFTPALNELAKAIDEFLSATGALLAAANGALVEVMPSGRGMVITELTGGLLILRRIEAATGRISQYRSSFTGCSERVIEAMPPAQKAFAMLSDDDEGVNWTWECWWSHLETPPKVT